TGVVELSRPSSNDEKVELTLEDGASRGQPGGDGPAQVDRSATVPAGQTSAEFRVTTRPVEATTKLSVTGTYKDEKAKDDLTVLAPEIRLVEVVLDKNTLTGGNATQGKVTLSGPAPRDILVRLRADRPEAVELTNVATVPAGQKSAPFTAKA